MVVLAMVTVDFWVIVDLATVMVLLATVIVDLDAEAPLPDPFAPEALAVMVVLAMVTVEVLATAVGFNVMVVLATVMVDFPFALPAPEEPAPDALMVTVLFAIVTVDTLVESVGRTVTVVLMVCLSVTVETPVVRIGTDRAVVNATVVLATVTVERIVLVTTLNDDLGELSPTLAAG